MVKILREDYIKILRNRNKDFKDFELLQKQIFGNILNMFFFYQVDMYISKKNIVFRREIRKFIEGVYCVFQEVRDGVGVVGFCKFLRLRFRYFYF